MLAGRRLIGIVTMVVSSTLPLPGVAGLEGTPAYTGDELSRLFTLSLRASPDDPPPITGSDDVDARIRSVAESRGYVLRPVADGPLEWVDGHRLAPDAAAAWRELQAAARAAGHPISLVSGYREVAAQRSLFLRRLSGTSESAIDRCLRWTAPPGYSKHHTGLALDITASGSRAGSFGSSGAHAWLTADDYRNAKRFGFIPSYPPDATGVGPDPEPWEWVFVGTDALAAGLPGLLPPTSPFRRF